MTASQLTFEYGRLSRTPLIENMIIGAFFVCRLSLVIRFTIEYTLSSC
jgi:hypothetical protein